MDYLHSTEIAKTNSVQDATHKDRERAWRRWITWLDKVGLEGDPYLDGFEIPQRVKLVAGFAISIRRGEHSPTGHEGPLVAGTVDKAISCLATTFKDNDKRDPRLSSDGVKDIFLSAMQRHFKNTDPKEKAQRAVTPEVLAYLFIRPKSDNFAQHIADLSNGAFFFACRSCEYAHTTGTRKTKIITPRNVVFRIRNKRITNPKLFHTATTVSITFVNKKNDNNFDTVTQHRNGHALQDPVALWARLVNRVLDLPGSTIDTTINAFYNKITNRVELVKSEQILQSLRWAVDELGVDHLGFTSDEIGCHSIRSAAAMAMFLNNVKTYTIMLQGRWCSDAFLRYIRKQVKEFSNGVSSAMVDPDTYKFYTMPDALLTFDEECDPKTVNNPRSLTSSFNGNSTLSAFTRHHIHN